MAAAAILDLFEP